MWLALQLEKNSIQSGSVQSDLERNLIEQKMQHGWWKSKMIGV
jgi:hypothetical protein